MMRLSGSPGLCPTRRKLLQVGGAALVMPMFPVTGVAAPSMDLHITGAGFAGIGGRKFRCALGRGGISASKREGDGATPMGTWPLREVLYRPDRTVRPPSVLPTTPLKPSDGWCDAPADPNYNRKVRHPYPASAERLWRRDDIYDLIVVVGYNDAPILSGKGSAIFLHVARPDYSPTAGCIAFARQHLITILGLISPRTRLVISA